MRVVTINIGPPDQPLARVCNYRMWNPHRIRVEELTDLYLIRTYNPRVFHSRVERTVSLRGSYRLLGFLRFT